MLEPTAQPMAAVSRASALARWDNEGGALSHPVPVKAPHVDVVHHLSDQEMVCLRSRVIALENVVIAMLAGGSHETSAPSSMTWPYSSDRPSTRCRTG